MSKIKNFKVATKLWLIIIPAIVTLVLLLISFIYCNNSSVKGSKTILYDEVYVSTAAILNADRDLYQAAIAEKELYLDDGNLTAEKRAELIGSFDENAAQALDRVNQAIDNIESNTSLYKDYKYSGSDKTLKELYEDFESNYKIWIAAYDLSTGTGDMAVRQAAFDAAREDLNVMTELFESYAKTKANDIQASSDKIIIGAVIAVTVVILINFFFSKMLVNNLKGGIRYLTDINKRIAGGELSIKVDEERMTRDELGELSVATGQILDRLNSYVDYIKEIAQVLETMADGDMCITLSKDYTGEFSSIKDALIDISASLNNTLSSISASAEQVSVGSAQVSEGAQTLAQGATEQASAVEELSVSISEVSDEVRKNAANVKQATDYVGQVTAGVETSNLYMQQMLQSMNDMKTRSNEISKIIKVIDDIAFQTNILSLNAAVEAARAGQYGKGFAVVADEVRNLAIKSADAAKQTTALIEGAIQAVSEGLKNVDSTAHSLEDVSSKTTLIKDIIAKIDIASSDQATAITQITQGLAQISDVIQTTSATAEESAAASDELAGQSSMLYTQLSKFKLETKAAPPAVTQIEL